MAGAEPLRDGAGRLVQHRGPVLPEASPEHGSGQPPLVAAFAYLDGLGHLPHLDSVASGLGQSTVVLLDLKAGLARALQRHLLCLPGLSASERVLDVLPTPLDEGAGQVDVLREAHDIDCRLMAVDRGPGSCGQGDYIAHSWQDGYGNGGDGAMLR